MAETTFWLLSTFFWIAVMSFYSMQEMAVISCNKLRLDFAVAKRERWALWLQSLLEQPSRLFCTTLIGVNVALMVSSESSRRLFEAWGLDPNFAPLAEIPVVLIFGELIPMFAARIYADHASRLGVSLLYFSAKLLYPIIQSFEFFFRTVGRIFGKKEKQESLPFLSRDELQMLLEEHQAGFPGETEEADDMIMSNIFALRNKRAFQLMQRLNQVQCVSSRSQVSELREIVKASKQSFFPVYHRTKQKIVGYIYPNDVLAASNKKRIEEYSEPAYFVSEDAQSLEILTKLQEQELDAAIVLNAKGEAQGIIYLEDLLDELFGSEPKRPQSALHYLEKTVSADMPINAFNEEYGTAIDPHECTTFAELIEKLLERAPHPQDVLQLETIEIIVKETSLFKAKTIQIRTKI